MALLSLSNYAYGDAVRFSQTVGDLFWQDDCFETHNPAFYAILSAGAAEGIYDWGASKSEDN